MKYLFLFSFLSFAFYVKAAESDTLRGVWKVSKKGDMYSYHFVNDSVLKVAHQADTISYKYKIDTAVAWPKKIDIAQIDRITGESLFTNKGLFEFMGPTKVRIRFGEDDKDRPQSFMPKGNLETFVMVKQ
jgi:uncharacterized protein (TIGR03067 family)